MRSIEELTTEVETLRRVNGDLLGKKLKNRDRIAVLEAEKIELQSRVDSAEQRIKTVAVERPVARLLKSISFVPEVLSEQLAKQYRFECDDQGELLLMNLDGTPALKDKAGKPLPVDESSVRELLTPKGSEEASAKVYRHLLSADTKASGGGGRGSGGALFMQGDPTLPKEPDRPKSSPYGLR